jgi:hypothetical protein
MPYDNRKSLMQTIEEMRGKRTLITLFNFDRISVPPLPGVSTQFHLDLKESLYRILKESPSTNGIDIFLYTRGGDTNSVWPIVSLIKEFDANFEVLIPFRAHSAGTLLAISAKKILMTNIAELSPVDPSTGNQFNPLDPVQPGNRLGISTEDVNAYIDFIKEAYKFSAGDFNATERAILQSHIAGLTQAIHPLALGNVYRVQKLVNGLARKLLSSFVEEGPMESMIKKLTVEPYSHLHMFNRQEAAEILGAERIIFAEPELEKSLDDLLRQYEDDFQLRSPLFASRLMGPNDSQKSFTFVGGVVESRFWSYLFKTKGIITQTSELPPNVNVQLPPGQPMPLVPGLPRKYNVEVHEQKWYHNTRPEGVTL